MIILNVIYPLGGRTLVRGTKNSTKENQDVIGIRKVVAVNPQNIFNHPKKKQQLPACYTQFFVGGKPPQGLRDGINLERMKYICQQGNQQENQQGNPQTYYGTMFDEGLGIPLFSAYTLRPGDKPGDDLDFKQRTAQKWRETPGN